MTGHLSGTGLDHQAFDLVNCLALLGLCRTPRELVAKYDEKKEGIAWATLISHELRSFCGIASAMNHW